MRKRILTVTHEELEVDTENTLEESVVVDGEMSYDVNGNIEFTPTVWDLDRCIPEAALGTSYGRMNTKVDGSSTYVKSQRGFGVRYHELKVSTSGKLRITLPKVHTWEAKEILTISLPLNLEPEKKIEEFLKQAKTLAEYVGTKKHEKDVVSFKKEYYHD